MGADPMVTGAIAEKFVLKNVDLPIKFVRKNVSLLLKFVQKNVTMLS